MDEDTLTVETDEDEQAVSPESSGVEGSDKGVSSDLIRGHINTIILRALYDGDKYGYEIIAEIERKSSGQYSLKQPSLYSALKRLEKDGYITSYWGGSVGGGRRKYFSLTEEGKAVSEQNQAEWEYSRTIIDSLISDRDFDFNRPAPTAVDMRVLRRSTSRVPSREGDEEESEEFSFEPGFDDAALKEQIEASYNEKLKALEEEYAEKLAALDKDRADFEEEKARLQEEMNARERALADSYEANLRQLDLIRAQQEAALQEQRNELEREKEAFAADKEAHERDIAEEKAQLAIEREKQSEVQNEADESLKEELELQKQKLAETEEEHERALSALKEANEQALAEQKEACDATLRAEKELRERDLRESSEKYEQELAALAERHEQEMESLQNSARENVESAVRLAREEEDRLKDNQFQAEKARYSELLTEERNRYTAALAEESARHEAQIRDDRMRYQQALEDQIATLRKQMELEMAERERQIIHHNYISLVDSPASGQGDPQPARQDTRQTEENYRNVVANLYGNTVRPAQKPADVSATPVSGIDFRDIQKRASRDGLRVETVGGETPPAAEQTDAVNTVHKGKALFLSSIVVFFWCILIGGITMGLRETLSIPLFYPCLMWCIGLAFLLTAGLMYANHFGANRLRKPSLALINSIVVYALLAIFALIIALSVRIDFGDISKVMMFIVLPIIYFIGVLIFGICYYLQIKPKKQK